jgi:hypothetical protein
MTDMLVPSRFGTGELSQRQSPLSSSFAVRSIAVAPAAEAIYLHAQRPTPNGFSQDLFAQLEVLLNLPPKWDGDDAPVVTTAALTVAERVVPIAAGWPTCAQLIPTRHGGISIEVHSLRGDISIDVDPTGATELFFSETETGLDAEGPIGQMLNEHVAVLNRIISG